MSLFSLNHPLFTYILQHHMERTSTVLAAFEAGKLPSTQQTNNFIDWLAHVGLTQLEPTAHTALSAQGRVLADDVRAVLDAYKQLGKNKNCTLLSFISVQIGRLC